MKTEDKNIQRIKRKKRIRKHLSGTEERPRLSVFRSSKHMYAQIIDDTSGSTLVSASTVEKDMKAAEFENKVAKATAVGKLVGERAAGKGITKVVFDRNGFMYHGRVKAVADAARKTGLDF